MSDSPSDGEECVPPAPDDSKTMATKSARNKAAELGMDITQVTASSGDFVSLDDVLSAVGLKQSKIHNITPAGGRPKGSKKQKRQIKEARTTVTGEKDAQRDELLLDDNMLEVRPLFDTCV